MSDQIAAANRAYGDAAEAFFVHVNVCPDCSVTGSRLCPVGRPLAEAEDATWKAYRAVTL